MKRMTFAKHLCASVVFSALAVSTAHAQDQSTIDLLTAGWSGTATFGATASTGNTEATNYTAGIRLGKTIGRWEHLVFGVYFKGDATSRVQATNPDGSDRTVTIGGQQVNVFELRKTGNADRLTIGYQPRFYWRARTYLFGILDFERDRPANIKSSTRQVFGIGHKFWATESGFLSAEAGFGNKTTKVLLGENDEGAIAFIGANYLQDINEQLTFNADFRADLGSDNNYSELGLGLAYKLSTRMSLKLTHQIRSNSDISDPTLVDPSETDNVTNLTLEVDI